MPTYQYACTACEHRFEAIQKFSDASLSECPECTGRLRKLYGSVGVVFKGSGFYRTDSRSGSKTASETPSTGTGDAAKPAAKTAETSSTSTAPAASSSSTSSTTTSTTAKAS